MYTRQWEKWVVSQDRDIQDVSFLCKNNWNLIYVPFQINLMLICSGEVDINV
jgi:hypothetical protein